MKKFILSFIYIFICSVQLFSQVPSWAWAKSAGGINSDQGNSITTDVAGNIYATGNFNSASITFGNITLTNTDASGNTSDIFIAKYSPSGNVIRAWSAQGSSIDYSNGITTDAKGNVYITGEFQSPSITFGNITLTLRGGGDVFIAKYDSSGNALWAKCSEGNSMDYGSSVAVDVSGNAYITGGFRSSLIKFDSVKLANVGLGCSAYEVFTAKYDTSGNVLWAKSGNGTGSDFGRGVITDKAGNVYVTGQFASPYFWFGTDTLINFSTSISKSKTTPSDIFIVKYDSSGDLLWAKDAGGNSVDYACSIDILNSDIYITGGFASDSIIFDTISIIKSYTNSCSNIFVAKYDSSGNALWVRQAYCMGIYGDNAGFSIQTGTNNKINVTGTFTDSLITFGGFALTDAGFNDIFIAQYDALGNVIWAKDAGGRSNDYPYGVTSDAAGYIYLTGYFQDTTVTFGSTTLVNAGGIYNPPDVFVAKLNSGSPLGINVITPGSDNTFSIFPDPTNGNFSLLVPEGTRQIRILNSLGQAVQETVLKGETKINYRIYKSGIYFISVITDKNTITKKLIVCN